MEIRDGDAFMIKRSPQIVGHFECQVYSSHNDDGSRERDGKGRFSRRLKWSERGPDILADDNGVNMMLNVELKGR